MKALVAIVSLIGIGLATPVPAQESPPAATPETPPATVAPAIPPATPAPAATAPVNDAAEIAFWNSVKDTRNPRELQAYIQAYPTGTFSTLARLRINALEEDARAKAAPPPPPPAPKPAPAPAPVADLSDPAVMREIQVKLYGVLDAPTQTAIRDWQKRAEFTPTGTLLPDQLARLRASTPSSTWGAMAYTARAYVATVSNRPSRADAEQAARNECKRRQGKNADCTVVTAADKACMAIAVYKTQTGKTIHWGAYSALRPEIGDAIAEAMRSCNAQQFSKGSCVQRATLCADGSNSTNTR
jgi:hypothetical protein